MTENILGDQPSSPGVHPFPMQKTVFKTAENEARVMAFYDARLARWPVPYESLTVSTRYGRTHVIASGAPEAPPLVLTHAAGINATVWMPNAAALSRNLRMLAVDTIGELGKSRLDDFDVYPKNGREASQWLSDLFDGLGIKDAYLVGSSLGGWYALNHALYAPDRVKRLALLGSMGLPTWRATLNILFRIIFTGMFPSETNKERMIKWLFGSGGLGDEESREAAEWLAYLRLVLDLNIGSRTAMPFPLSNGKLRQLTVPTLLILGENDRIIGEAKKIAARARRHIPRVETTLMANAGHIMAAEKPDFVNEQLLRFFERD
jgi:pimeloyl-ACP methyl ester carboxylesterase